MSDKQEEKLLRPKHIGFSQKKVLLLGFCVALVFGSMFVLVVKYKSHKRPSGAAENSAILTKTTAMTPDSIVNEINASEEKLGALNSRMKTLYDRRINKGDDEKRAKITRPVKPQRIQEASDELKSKQADFLKEVASSALTIENKVDIKTVQSMNASGGTIGQEVDFQNKLLQSVNSMQQPEYAQQNGQSEKRAFLKKMDKKSDFYIDSSLQKPVSPYEIKAGTVINAAFVTGINSDLPGEIIGQVTHNVYDSVTGNHLLIPQGTKLIGRYDSSVSYGQERVLMAWSRLIMPNGDSFDLKGQPGADLQGLSGISDKVDNHTFKIFGSALMFSLFSAAGQLSQPQTANNQYPSNGQIIFGAIGQQLTQTGAQLVMKNMNIQPTINIRPGKEFNVLLTRDMILPGAYQYKTKEITVWAPSSSMGTK